MSDEILLEIRELREEMSSLTEKLSKLRYSDFKNLCTENMRPIVAEEGRRLFETDIQIVEESTKCQMRSDCISKISEMISSSLDLFEDGKIKESLDLLAHTKEMFHCHIDLCQDKDCSRMAMEMLQKISSVQNTYLKILESMDGDSAVPVSSPSSTEDEVEKYLMPLSNSKRVGIMRSLSECPKNLSYLCKEFNMPSGHITFHLNALKDMGYVVKDSKTKLYSISVRGSVALNGINSLIHKLKTTF